MQKTGVNWPNCFTNHLFLFVGFPVEVQIPSSPKPNQRVAPETGTDGVAGLFYFSYFVMHVVLKYIFKTVCVHINIH